MMEFKANSMFFLEHLKGYSQNPSLEPPHRVLSYLPTNATRYTRTVSIIFFFLHRFLPSSLPTPPLAASLPHLRLRARSCLLPQRRLGRARGAPPPAVPSLPPPSPSLRTPRRRSPLGGGDLTGMNERRRSRPSSSPSSSGAGCASLLPCLAPPRVAHLSFSIELCRYASFFFPVEIYHGRHRSSPMETQ
jgi:hypothetical protein